MESFSPWGETDSIWGCRCEEAKDTRVGHPQTAAMGDTRCEAPIVTLPVRLFMPCALLVGRSHAGLARRFFFPWKPGYDIEDFSPFPFFRDPDTEQPDRLGCSSTVVVVVHRVCISFMYTPYILYIQVRNKMGKK